MTAGDQREYAADEAEASPLRGECIVHSGWHAEGRICLGWKALPVPSRWREWRRWRNPKVRDNA